VQQAPQNGKPLTGILSVRLLDGKNARPSEHPFSAALIETRRKIARAAEQSVLTEVFGFSIPAAPRFIAPEHFAG